MAKAKRTPKAEPKRRRRQNVNVADWDGSNAELLRSVIGTVTKGGGAIRFGYSRDGGAYSVGIYGDGEPFSEYLPGTADVDEWLTEIREDYE